MEVNKENEKKYMNCWREIRSVRVA
jgi:hypothetical protein